MTKNQEYIDAVVRGEYPKENKVPLDNNFINHNGVIQNLVLTQNYSAAIITSIKGSTRANHHHLDYHFAVVLEGSIFYFEREVGSKEILEPVLYKAGDMFFTPPGKEHSMVFPEETKFLTLSNDQRTHEKHEANLTRVEYITPEIAKKYIP